MSHPGATPSDKHKVVIIGSGFGGLNAAQKLKRADVDIKLIAKTTHHLFQPLLYQVATGIISEGEIAPPTRVVLRNQKNCQVLLGEVTDINLANQTVDSLLLGHTYRTPYDTLIVAAGAGQSYFGNDQFAEWAPGMKTIDDALELRGRILGAFEQAERSSDPDRREKLLTFVVVGAGPTGVEMAGQIAELARGTLRGQFRSIDSAESVVLLIETADRVLTAFPPSLSRKAARSLESLGVTLLLERTVVAIDEEAVTVAAPDGGTERIPARNAIWAAGVEASRLASQLGELSGADVDRAGRVTVEPDLTLPGHPEVLALGDMVRVRSRDGGVQELLGVAPVAMQQGRYAAKLVRARLSGRPTEAFHYLDKGNLATIGRARAVADLHLIRLSGFAAWAAWLVVHIFYLIGFQNRLIVLIRWFISFATRGRGARLITNTPDGEDDRERQGDGVARVTV